MPTTDTPLRYPGGKTQLSPLVSDLLRSNDLLRGVYAEPFAGGAGVAWRLLLSGHVSEVWLNDIDQGIHSFWKSVLENCDDFCELIQTTNVTIEEWHKQRKTLQESRSTLKIGFATLFLNRTNRSGIIGAGVIGGKEQTGNYKLDCRFNKPELIDKIKRIASYSEVVKLTRDDAKVSLDRWSKELPARSLINIDPPYFAKGQDLYTNFYNPSDHETLAAQIRRLKRPWMLTYDDTPEIEQLYAGLPVYRKGLVYYAQVKRRANELLVISPNLTPPACLQQPAPLAA